MTGREGHHHEHLPPPRRRPCDRARRPLRPPLRELAERVSGRLHTPADPDWAATCVPWRVNVEQHPMAVLDARDTHDVVAALKLGRRPRGAGDHPDHGARGGGGRRGEPRGRRAGRALRGAARDQRRPGARHGVGGGRRPRRRAAHRPRRQRLHLPRRLQPQPDRGRDDGHRRPELVRPGVRRGCRQRARRRDRGRAGPAAPGRPGGPRAVLGPARRRRRLRGDHADGDRAAPGAAAERGPHAVADHPDGAGARRLPRGHRSRSRGADGVVPGDALPAVARAARGDPRPVVHRRGLHLPRRRRGDGRGPSRRSTRSPARCATPPDRSASEPSVPWPRSRPTRPRAWSSPGCWSGSTTPRPPPWSSRPAPRERPRWRSCRCATWVVRCAAPVAAPSARSRRSTCCRRSASPRSPSSDPRSRAPSPGSTQPSRPATSDRIPLAFLGDEHTDRWWSPQTRDRLVAAKRETDPLGIVRSNRPVSG